MSKLFEQEFVQFEASRAPRDLSERGQTSLMARRNLRRERRLNRAI